MGPSLPSYPGLVSYATIVFHDICTLYLFLNWNEKKDIPFCFFLFLDYELWHNPKSFSMHEIIPGTPGTVGCCGWEIVFIFLLHQRIYNPPSHRIKTWISCYNKNATSNMTRKKMNEEGVITVYLDQSSKSTKAKSTKCRQSESVLDYLITSP